VRSTAPFPCYSYCAEIPQATLVITPTLGCHYFLPAQLQSVTVDSWYQFSLLDEQRHMRVNDLSSMCEEIKVCLDKRYCRCLRTLLLALCGLTGQKTHRGGQGSADLSTKKPVLVSLFYLNTP